MTARTIEIALGDRRYAIEIGRGLIGHAAALEATGRPCRVITDEQVAAHHLAPVKARLTIGDDDCFVIPPGESQKTLTTASAIVDWLAESNLPRDGVVVALGGGVIGDLAGFAAAIYHRGIDFIQVPTTLLAQVDSSVGGKTGVNHARGKNLVGAFHQPRAVVADLATLDTLPDRELKAGLAEVIKTAWLSDAAFCDWLDAQLPALLARDPEALAHAVETCCRAKAGIVARDERESGVRALLNLGHTFGHAIETHGGHSAWLHGEAVGAGLCMAADLSTRLGWLDPRAAIRLKAQVGRTGLPTTPPTDLEPDRFRELMGRDKKVRGGQLRFVLLRAPGHAEVTAEVPDTELDAVLAGRAAP